MKNRFGWLALGLALLAVVVIGGVRARPVEGNSDDRLFALAAQLKCITCVGESVAGSQSSFAVAARGEIKRQMAIGKSDDEILASFSGSYPGVLLNPPNTGWASVVWVVPPVVFGLALAAVIGKIRQSAAARATSDAAPSDEDVALVDSMLAARDTERLSHEGDASV